MCDSTLSELLVLFLLFASSARVLYIREARIDALASLPQIAFVLSLVNIFIWGFSPFEIWIAFIAFYQFMLNIPAAIKVWAYLYVDYYHPVFRFFSVFAFLINIITIAIVFYFRPVYAESKAVSVESYKYAGKFSTGFTHVESKLEKADAVLTIFKPKQDSLDTISYKTDAGDTVTGTFMQGKPIVIFIGDKRASVDMYRPYLQKIAEDGYTVIAGEFFSNDMKWIEGAPDTPHFRRLVINIEDLSDVLDVEAQKTNFTARIVKEYTMLLYLAGEFNPEQKPFFLIGDKTCSDALPLTAAMFKDAVTGFFDMSSVETYPAGYGCIEQTDPFLAFLHGRKRDSSLKIPKMLAARSEENIILHSQIQVNSIEANSQEQK